MKASRRLVVVAKAGALAAGVAVLVWAGWWWSGGAWRERTYVIGFEDSEPEHWQGMRGGPEGPIVDIVQEAARRSGVQLRWVYQRRGPDEAMKDGSVDLWPLMARLEERGGHADFTEPYHKHTYWQVTVKGRQRPGELPRILVQRSARLRALIRKENPGAQYLQRKANQQQTLSLLCLAEADVAVISTGFGDRALDKKPDECQGVELVARPLQEAERWYSIGARRGDRGASRAAAAIREAISEMAEDGGFATITLNWSIKTTGEIATIEAMLRAERQKRRMGALLALLVAALAVLLWQERRLRRAKRAAEEVSRTKTEFLANMSHEIRTPMNGVMGMAELLRTTALDDEQAEYAGIIHSAAGGLLNIVNDIIDLSRVESGKLTMEEKPFEPAAVIREAARLFSLQASAKGLAFDLEMPEESAWVFGDALRFRQIALNLMSNAVKFTEKGRIAVGLGQQKEGEAVRTRLEVRDTGVGIAKGEIDKLFANYSQLDSLAERRGDGSGLGLAISQRLAMLMGGRLGVESKLGSGSTFWFTVSLRPAAETPRENSVEPVAARSGGKPRVLVVEDNAISQRLAVRMLEKLGCEAEVAGDGATAFAKLMAGGWNAVLMDWRLPDTTGLELTRKLRQVEGGGAGLPVIALTANAMQGDRETCLAAGMTDYLTKPIELERLRQAIERWSTAPAAGGSGQVKAPDARGDSAEDHIGDRG